MAKPLGLLLKRWYSDCKEGSTWSPYPMLSLPVTRQEEVTGQTHSELMPYAGLRTQR